jgi:hypothetical protein
VSPLALAFFLTGAESYGDQLWDAVKGPLTTVLKWLVYVLLVMAAIAVVLVIRRAWRLLPPRRGMVVSLEDLGADVRERQAASYVLSRQLLAEMTALSSTDDAARAGIDESRDLDRSFVANLRIAGDGVERLDSLTQGEPAVSFGPLSFNARQLAYFFGTFFRRRAEHELAGSLTPSREGVVVTVESKGPARALDRWQVARAGQGAASESIRDLAMQIVVGLGCSTATADWRSFRDYRKALEALGKAGEAEDTRSVLEQSRLLLSRSLDRDPLNPLARFYLGTVERKLGENQAAVEQFRVLESFVARAAAGRLRHFVDTVHPDFRPVVRYNLAVSLLKLDATKDQREALRKLNSLRDRLDKGQLQLTKATAYRFKVLVWSALAWALTFELERELENKQQAQGPNERPSKLLSEIEDLSRSIEDATPLASEDGADYVNALAVAENAHGRALDSLGHKPNAVERYRRATALLPDFIDAQLNLAGALLNLKDFDDWSEHAEAAIRQALRSDPSSRRAEYLYGRLCADQSVARYEEAKQHLKRAGDYSQALLLRARLAEQDDDLDGALRLLERAAAARPKLSYRLLVYAEFVLKLAQNDRATPELLERARERAARLAKEGLTTWYRDRGTELVAEINAALGTLDTKLPAEAKTATE